MKESEAKQKWCPHKIVIYPSLAAGNFVYEDPKLNQGPHHSCIGSACMMWEDHTPPPVWLNSNGKPQRQLADKHPPEGWKSVRIEGEKDWVEWHRVSDEPLGDCGLKTKESGCFYPG